MCISPPPKQGACTVDADVAACLKAPPSPAALAGVPTLAPESAAAAGEAFRSLRIRLADLAMLLCQLLLFINHLRRLMDADCHSPPGHSALSPAAAPPTGPLAAYPCSAPTASRIAFLVARADSTFLTALRLPLGELWVPLVTIAILAHLAALLLMPRRAYMAVGRLACMMAVGLLPKAVSLATFLAFPSERPSSYFGTYLPLEGAITVWQQVVYNYPFWPGMAVLTVHCALSTAICITVAPRLHAAAAPPLFSPAWVMAHTYGCAALAAWVALQQHPASAREVRAALRRMAAAVTAIPEALRRHRRRHREENVGGPGVEGSGSSAGGAAAAVAAAVVEDLQLKTALRRLLASSRSGSCASAASASFTASSASLGSSAAPSEPGSAAGSGSHVTAAGVAQTVAAAAGRPDAAAAQKARQLVSQQPQQQDGRGRPASRVVPLTYDSRTGSRNPRRLEMGMTPLGKGGTATASASSASAMGEGAAPPPPPGPPAASVAQPYVPYASAPSRASTSVQPSGALPPAGAFSLKQPTGLSKWTIVEDQEFQAPAAVGVGGSLSALGHVSMHSRRFRRYQSRAPPQRVHMKLPWAEPDQLPGNFLERLNVALSEGLDCMAVGVSVRAGCIELVFDIVPQAAFDSASDFQAGQSRRRHVQQHHHQNHHQPQGGVGSQPPLAPQRHLQPCRLELLGQVGAGVTGFDVDVDEAADPHGALEAAVLSGLLRDAEPASWIDALHLQPPPGAEVLTQACGRVWISRWDHTLSQWVPEKAGGLRPSQLPRITRLTPPCVVVRQATPAGGTGAVAAARGDGGPAVVLRGAAAAAVCAAVVRVSVSNADAAMPPPAFSARCRGRYLPVVARRVRNSPSDAGSGSGSEDGVKQHEAHPAAAAAASPDELAAPATFELQLPAGLPRNGLVVVECKVGKLLSNWRPLIVTEDAPLAAEIATLLAPPPPPPPSSSLPADAAGASYLGDDAEADAADAAAGWDDLANDLGLWLDYLEVLGLTTTAAAAAAASADAGGYAVDGRAAAAAPPAAAAAAAGGGLEAVGGGGGGAAAGGLGMGGWQYEGMAAEAALQPGSLDLGPGLAALYATEAYGRHMAGIAASLLEFAVDRGWLHTAGVLVAQMLAAGIPWSEVLRRCSSDGLTLLHRAVRSARGEVVALVMRLGEQHGMPFDWQAVSTGPKAAAAGRGDGATLDDDCESATGSGVTPLHLAASLPDGGRLAERILREYQAACQLWASAVDSHGVRPMDCALASGHLRLPDHKPSPAGNGTHAAAGATPAPPLPDLPPLPGGRQETVTRAAAAAAEPTEASTSEGEVWVGSGGRGGVSPFGAHSPRHGSQAARVRASASTALAAAADAAAAALAAPFVGDPRVEALYVQAVGAEYVLWCGGYLVYQICTVLAVAGRMVKEARVRDMSGMLLFCAPHLVSAVLLCADYGAWLRLREPLVVAVTTTRSAAKLLPVLGLLRYPNSATHYLSGGMDVLLEGLVPAYFERMRAPLVLPLRLLEGIATGLLYRSQQVQLRLAPPGVSALIYALAWTVGCGALTAALDAACRRRFAAARGGGGGGGWTGSGAVRARGGGAAEAAPGGDGSEGTGSAKSGKKFD